MSAVARINEIDRMVVVVCPLPTVENIVSSIIC